MQKNFRLKVIAAAAIVAIAGVSIASCTHTPQFRDASRQVLENSIAEERRIVLGGKEQYVLIRGANRNAPILLFLHGGPGTSALAYNRIHNSDLENDFVFVNWDQRGTGKSIAAGADRSTLTLDQMTNDLDELVDLLRAEFEQDQIMLIGHSWGSMLGLNYVSKHPEKIASYVGIGQMTNTPASEIEGYEWALVEANQRGDTKAVQTLEEIGAPPYATVGDMMAQRAIVNKFGGSWIKPKSDFAYAMEVIKAPEFAVSELTTILRGGEISLNALFDTFSNLKAIESYPTLNVPVVFIEGRQDRVVSPIQAQAYLNKLVAPSKELIWFEGSAHSPQWEEPAAFNREIVRIAEESDVLSKPR